MNLAKSRRVPVSPSACGQQGCHGEDIQDKIPAILKLVCKTGSTQWTQACTHGRDADSGVSVRTEKTSFQSDLPGMLVTQKHTKRPVNLETVKSIQWQNTIHARGQGSSKGGP